MRLFRKFEFRLAKEETTGEVFRRVRSVATDLSNGPPYVVFTCEDSHRRTSAVRRAVKRFPAIGHFEQEPKAPLVPIPRERRSISNALADDQPQPDLDILEAMAQGIPRSFPFFDARFVFFGIDWLHRGEGLPDVAAALTNPDKMELHAVAPYIFLGSIWGSRARDVWLAANVEVDPPANDVTRLPDLPADVRADLERLGKIALGMLVAVPSQEERAFLATVRPEDDRLTERVRADMLDPNISLAFPFEIPPYSPDSWAHSRVEASPKKAMLNAFGPLGYTYQSKLSGQGGYTLTKRSASNNEMEVFFDAGSWSGDLNGYFGYRGPLWRTSIHVPFAPGMDEIHWHSCGQEVLEHACRNAAVAVEYLEKTFVPALDALYGPAPAWFEYPK